VLPVEAGVKKLLIKGWGIFFGGLGDWLKSLFYVLLKAANKWYKNLGKYVKWKVVTIYSVL
jgi:hypothetical protein